MTAVKSVTFVIGTDPSSGETIDPKGTREALQTLLALEREGYIPRVDLNNFACDPTDMIGPSVFVEIEGEPYRREHYGTGGIRHFVESVRSGTYAERFDGCLIVPAYL